MALPSLTRSLIVDGHPLPEGVDADRDTLARAMPERVLQFGEGGFLRGFADWMVDRLNRKGLFDGRVVVVQPIPSGMVDRVNAQEGVYTLILRGLQDGTVREEAEVIGSISRGIDPFTDYEAFLECARQPELRFVLSNTTEAGIACDAADRLEDRPPASFPAKLTALLLERWRRLGGTPESGLVIIPCELIERNGDQLRRCVLETADRWALGREFREWVERHNVFANSLVDRIVTGYPRDEADAIGERLGYRDDLLDTGELFHAWVIEAPAGIEEELPFARAGLNVVWTEDVTPYRDRKVRILNGAHTMTVLGAYLAGRDTVGECMADLAIADYLRRGLHDEIIPTLDLPREELESFAAAVLERFSNPFVRHELLSISLNSTSKWKARVLPSLREYQRRTGELPPRLAFSLAALIAFYRGTELRGDALIGHRGEQGYPIRDDRPVLEAFAALWTRYDLTGDAGALVRDALARTESWGENLNAIPGLTEAVTAYLARILGEGAGAAMAGTGSR